MKTYYSTIICFLFFFSCSQEKVIDRSYDFQMALLEAYGIYDKNEVEIVILENNRNFKYLYDSLYQYSQKFIPKPSLNFKSFLANKIEDDLRIENTNPTYILRITRPIKIGDVYLIYVNYYEIKKGISYNLKNEMVGMKIIKEKLKKYYFEPDLNFGY